MKGRIRIRGTDADIANSSLARWEHVEELREVLAGQPTTEQVTPLYTLLIKQQAQLHVIIRQQDEIIAILTRPRWWRKAWLVVKRFFGGR